MKVTMKDGKACEKLLTIEIEASEIQKEYEAFYQAVTPKAKIRGFRPGRAPQNVIRMHYKNEAREHVLKHLISESYQKAVTEKALEPLTMPVIENVDFRDDHLSYQAKIEIRPKIKLSRVAGLSAKKEKVEVNAEEVEGGLKRVQESLAQYKAVEDRPAALGDFVIADYVCFEGGKEVEKRNDDWIEIREKDFLEGFSKQLIGVKPGDEKEIQVTFPAEGGRKELAGKQAVFQVKVKEIKTKILPEMNDDLAKEAGEFKSLAELKEKIEKEMVMTKEREKENRLERALLDELIKQNKVDLPEGLVERRTDYLLEKTREDFKKQGAPAEEFEKRKDEFRQELEKEARRQVQVAFLLDEIAIRENITASEEDLKQKYLLTAAQIRQPAERIEEYYTKNEKALESLRDQIRNEKVIEFIKKSAKIK